MKPAAVYCLVEAPSQAAAAPMRRDAHRLPAGEIHALVESSWRVEAGSNPAWN